MLHELHHRHSRALPLLLLLPAVVPLWGALFGGEALFLRDVLHYYWPTRTVVAEALASGRLPLWDVSQQAGLPLLANPHAAVLYLPNLLHQVLTFPTAYALLVWLHLGFAALGAYALARRSGLEVAGALVAGLAFGASGYLLGLVDAGPLLAGAAWVPWAGVVLLSEGGAGLKVPLLALVVAGQAVSGDPQAVIYSALLGLAILALWPDRRVRAGVLLGAFALAGLLAAVQLLPAWDLYSVSTRADTTPAALTQWSTHPLRLIELLFPAPFGGHVVEPRYWPTFVVRGPSPLPFAPQPYLGASVLALAVLGVRRRRSAFLGLLLAGTGLLLALGEFGPLEGLLTLVPPFRFFRYPEKYLLVASLGTSLLAGAGTDRLGRSDRRTWLGLGVAAAVLWAAWLVPAVAGEWVRGRVDAVVSATRGLGSGEGPVTAWSSALVHAALMLSALTLATLLLRGRARMAVVTVVVTLDLVTSGVGAVWTAPRALYEEVPPTVHELRAISPEQPFRFLRDTRALAVPQPKVLTYDAAIASRVRHLASLKSVLAGAFGLEEARGYGTVSLQRWSRTSLALWKRPARFARLFNACVAISGPGGGRYRGRPGFRPAASAPGLGISLFETAGCLPRLWSVPTLERAEDLEHVLARLSRDDFDPARTALVEGPVVPHGGTVRVVSSRHAPGRVSADVEADRDAFLVLADSWHPGWSASLDGAPQVLFPTNGALIGIPVPAGRHALEVRYTERLLPLGAALSGLGLLAVGLLLVRARRRLTAA